MILASFAEMLSLGAVLPFLAMLTDPARVFAYPRAQPVILALGLTEPKHLLLPLTLAFGLSALIAGAMRLMLLWASNRLTYAAGTDLSINIYRRTLYQPYAVHVARNSSEIIDGIASKSGSAIYTITAAINLISTIVMLIGVLLIFLAVDPIIAVSALLGFGLIYTIIIKLTTKRLLINSQTVARESTAVIKSLQEGLGGIRDILLDGSQETYCKSYSNLDRTLRRAQGNSQFISSSPRPGVEALGMLLIAALAFALAQQSDGIAKAIPVLGALALGAQRLLPALQLAYSSWSSIQSGQTSLRETVDLLDQSLPEYADQPANEQLPFQKRISLRNLWFRYNQESPWVLTNLDLTIVKGSRIGFIGVTGSGKSTLLDIVMGLLQPTDGRLSAPFSRVTCLLGRLMRTGIWCFEHQGC